MLGFKLNQGQIAERGGKAFVIVDPTRRHTGSRDLPTKQACSAAGALRRDSAMNA